MGKLIELLIAQYKYKKAMKQLAKDAWSTDYLIYLLRKSQIDNLSIKITKKNGDVLVITNKSPVKVDYYEEEKKFTMNDVVGILDMEL